MTSKVIGTLVVIAACSVACESRTAIGPTPTSAAPAASYTVHQASASPSDGATLAYGEQGRVEVAYTMPRQPTPSGPPTGYPILMPPQYAPPEFRVASCLSTDGATCITTSQGSTVSPEDGTVWNTLSLGDSFRGRVSETSFVIHQLTVTRAGLSHVTARDVTALKWHFR
jgi:hypothetical protein